MHLFINSLAASAGGGLTYIRNIIPQLAGQEVRVTIAAAPGVLEGLSVPSNVDILQLDVPVARRFWFEQIYLPQYIRKSRADVLLSTGNFALRKSPVPQLLLSRNSIYTSEDFYRDLRSRHDYRLLLDTRLRAILAKRSIHWADLTIAPSESFAADLRKWTGSPVIAVHHGFDWAEFTRSPLNLDSGTEKKLAAAEPCLKLLFVSHYNYYRNFETLIRALPAVRDQLYPQKVKLLLTCELADGKNPGSYHPKAAVELIQELGVTDMVIELGAVKYRDLHHLYARADVYVSPAYTETFAHPVVEAMASGIPVVASDIAVHREICGEGATYFDRFNAAELALSVAQILQSAERRQQIANMGKLRSKEFSWQGHVKKILELAEGLLKRAD